MSVGDQRIRTLTERAMEEYTARVRAFTEQFVANVNVLEAVVERSNEISTKCRLEDLNKLRKEVFDAFAVIEESYKAFQVYLTQTRTEESAEESQRLQTSLNKIKATVDKTIRNIDRIKLEKLETASLHSRASTTRTSKSALVNQKLAEVEAARVRQQYAERENAIHKERASAAHKQADLEAELDLLNQKKETAALEAEASALERLSNYAPTELDVEDADPLERVQKFVQDIEPLEEKNIHPIDTGTLNPKATEFNPLYSTSNDLTRFLLRKDLMLSRLTVFNDKAENYQAWKCSFLAVTKELFITPSEEIDLLIKWLGETSRKHALSLRTAYIREPSVGLVKIWSRLDERFGAEECVYDAVVKKLEAFPRLSVKDSSKLYDLSDILSEINGLKEDPKYSTTLSYFDSCVGINPVVSKLPQNLQEKWINHAANYKKRYDVQFPPFAVLAEFVHDQSKIRNDPSFRYDNTTVRNASYPLQVTEKKVVSVRKTEVEVRCPIHKTNHSLESCRVFKMKPFVEKRKFLSSKRLCFRCFSDKHQVRDCKSEIKCNVCSSKSHSTVMHTDTTATDLRNKLLESQDDERKETSSGRPAERQDTTVKASCTEICESADGKSCSKIVLVNVHPKNDSDNVVKCYCIIDEQSNRSLIKSELLSQLGIDGETYEYVLKTCGGSVVTSGRRANDMIVESLDGSCTYALPTLIECLHIPSNKNEICTAENAKYHTHLSHIADKLPDFDCNADVLLLLGRDVVEAHHVFDQVLGPPGAPFAQRLGLGWVVIGELCLGQIHARDFVNVNKTYVLDDGRTSLFQPCCDRSMSVQDPIFIQTPDDNKPSLSVDDREFLNLMDKQVQKSPDGSWVAPLPLRSFRPRLPNNRIQVVRRTHNLLKSLEKNPSKSSHFFDFMDKLFSNGHAEIAPNLGPHDECWYLPIFGIYHPKKPQQVRVVFDSSAKFEGISLNSVLLQGPDLTNGLLGVLMRFRKDEVAVVGDIEQMFYSFGVQEKDRNLLRFLWFRDNDPNKELIEYRMCKHVFGNSPSPAIATFCLRKSVEHSDDDVQRFVRRDFYVDDGLSSQPSVEKAVDLIVRSQRELSHSKLRLHKIASNKSEVLKQFPVEDLSKGLKDVDLECGNLPSQRSLGIVWNIEEDKFVFKLDMPVQSVTKRGILSTINSIFDPIGFLAPVVLEGRLILRELMSTKVDWDECVPTGIVRKWENWRTKLDELMSLDICRSYFRESLSQMLTLELHIFADASVLAISAVAYVVGHSTNGERHVGFILGKSKLAPEKGHSIPRLELCAAVLATQICQSVCEQLDVTFADIKFYTDSRVVLGYICNQSRRFYQYVGNRVQKILHVCNSSQWNYVPTGLNPADIGSRGASAQQLKESPWLSGPKLLLQEPVSEPEHFPLLTPEHDKEIRPEVSVKLTSVEGKSLSSIFIKFSSFESLVRAISNLRHVAVSYHKKLPCKGWHVCANSKNLILRNEVKCWLFRTVQLEVYSQEIELLSAGKYLNRDSNVLSLDPILGSDGLLRVGGRINRSELPISEKTPIILPGKHPISRLLVQHYHKSVHHQGRLFTEGAVRSAGFWVTGCKRLVSSVIRHCVICKRLRGNFVSQKMSDLPVDRVNQASPFSYVGVDVFGPWQIVTRRTRGGSAVSKRWAVLFTCLTIRAVHIEVIEDMSSSAFTNALRRFISVRGKVEQFRSDRGTNFVGAIDNIQAEAVNVEDEITLNFLRKTGAVWLFNSPHSSHMGGAWERMIGTTRRILEAMLLNIRTLTHDVLVTLMAEIAAIINSRPIVPVSTDPEVPDVLSPSALLTQKVQVEQSPVGKIDIKDLYKEQWKQVQYLASQFWLRWRREYLQTLQKRCKWNRDEKPLNVDDIVLLKDVELSRNCWPMGRVSRVFLSADNKVRKVEVCVIKKDNKVYYTRPVVDLVLLVAK